jgi:PAS domain S-box-containing protein
VVSQSTYEESLFSSAFHHAPIGMCISLTDGRSIKVNPAFCKIVGYTEEELLNISLRHITHPEDVTAHQKYVDQLLQGEIPTFRIHKLGHIILAFLSMSLVRDQEGHPKYVIGQIIDIRINFINQSLYRSRVFRHRKRSTSPNLE